MDTFLVLLLFFYAFLQLMLISTTFWDIGQTSSTTGTDRSFNSNQSGLFSLFMQMSNSSIPTRPTYGLKNGKY